MAQRGIYVTGRGGLSVLTRRFAKTYGHGDERALNGRAPAAGLANADGFPLSNGGGDVADAHLRVERVVAGYSGGPAVLRGISFAARRGEVVAVLGRNGAGKTTLLRTISGLLSLREGSIHLDSADLRGRMPHQVARLGVGHVPEGRRVIPSMTVIDNLRLGGYLLRSRSELNSRLDDVFAMLPMLTEWGPRVAGTLSGGEQQLLSIARALMGGPTAMLLDEPLTGLAPLARGHVIDALKQIRDLGKAVVVVEQNVAEILPAADYALIIDSGEVALEGPAEKLMGDPAVQEKYLGLSIEGKGVEQS
jgi:branched-chain amino acid transport system ATP-binding protein